MGDYAFDGWGEATWSEDENTAAHAVSASGASDAVPSTNANAALEYAARGCHVLPVWWIVDGHCACPKGATCDQKPGKHPITQHGLNDATTDEAAIRAWWSRWPNANIGIALKPSGLIAFDIDKPENYEALAAIERELGGLPRTPLQRSGSGNVHRIWRAPDCEIRGELRGITLRGRNYIVVAPSAHVSGGRYQWEPGRSLDDIDPPELPPGLLEMVRRPEPVAATSAPRASMGADVERTIERARPYLDKMEPAIAGQGGHAALWAATCRMMHGFDLDDATVKSLLVEHYNPRCQPAWSEREIDHKIEQARAQADVDRWRVENREPEPRQRVSSRVEGRPSDLGNGEPDVDSGPNDAGHVPTEPQPYKPVSVLAVDAANADTPPIRSYSTGNRQLDHLTGGINTRELAVVMGPPGGCKTAWAISTSSELARRIPVLYVSTELEQHELMARFAANVLQRPWSGIRRGVVARPVIAGALEGLDVRLIGCELLPRDGDAALKLIEHEARWMADQYQQPPAIVLDYLQDLARGAERELRARIGDLATAARAMSQRLDCPVVAISSVARTFYSMRKAQEFREADDPTVYLAAAKESGDVDYAAARVLFLDAEDDRDKPERAVRIAVAKSRDGQVGFAGARVIAECGKFMADPGVVEEMAAAGRAVNDAADASDEADEVMYARVVREHAKGNGNACTKRYLRIGNKLGKRPLGKERAEGALDRLELAGRLRIRAIERAEGGKTKVRDVYEPAARTEVEP